MWAAFMCPVKDRGCDPEWVSDTDVFGFWKDHPVNSPVSSDVKYDSPPF
jgi:hypothetical protein